jgi:anti-sigma-K factor RskA
VTEPSDDILIEEMVLGLADPADAARLEEMAKSDPALAARLERARARFAPLDDTAKETALPEGFWDRVERGLDAAPAAAAAPAQVVDLAAVRALTRWRTAALAGIAATVLLALTLGWSLQTAPDRAVIAVLLNDRGEAVALVESGLDNSTLVTLLERSDVAAEQVMQVWTKPEDEGPPVSLGLLAEGTSARLDAPQLPAPHVRQLYEITVEPAGGSPTDLPTGPILGKGLAQEPVV